MKKKRSFIWWIPYLGLLAGLVIIAYFPVTEMLDAYRRQKVIDSLEQTVYEMDDSERQEMLAQARAYNEKLAGKYTEIPSDKIWPYEKQLAPKGYDVAFSYLQIPDIGLKMPVYHGTDNNALSAGVGHLEGSSLPVGGTDTHCVLTAHSGMQNMRAFDDIRDLEKGDVFGISTQGELFTYEVYEIETVLPDEIDSLNIRPGEDLCTLITCTPYGINTHRLLVHGRRCPVPEGFGKTGMDMKAVIKNRRVWPFLLAILAVLIVLLIAYRKKSKKRKQNNEKKRKEN